MIRAETQNKDPCTHRLNPVSYPHDQLSIFLHLVHKLHGEHSTVKCFAKLLCCSIQGASKTIPLATNGKKVFKHATWKPNLIKQRSYNGEKARGEARDQVFACASADNCVVGTRNGRPVIGSNHEAHLNELAGIPRQPAQKTNPISP